MSEMKTLTLNGQTYTLRDGNAARAIVCQAKGSAIALSDSAEAPLKGLTLYGKTVQSGTPTPDAPIPLESAGASGTIAVTVAGKNLLKNNYASATTNGVTFTVNEDGSIQTSGTASEDTYIKVGEVALEAGVKYTLSGCPSGGSTTTYTLYIASKNLFDLGNGNSFTADGSVYAVWLKICSGCNTSDLVIKPMIRLADTSAEYEPFKETQTLTVSTPNGLKGIGDVGDSIDFRRGAYSKRVGQYTFTGNEVWGLNDNGSLQAQLIAVKDVKIGSQIGLCEFAKYNYYYLGDGMFLFRTDGMIYAFAVIGAALAASAGLTVENVGAAIAGKKVIYELAEPAETPLSSDELAAYAALHSNYPNTTVYSDAGAGMALSYVADTRAYIDNKLAALT